MENACYTIFRRSYLTVLCGNHFETFIGQQSARPSKTIVPRLSLASSTSDDHTGDDSQGKHFYSSSYNHHRYHRGSYEHKRQRSKEQSQSSARNESPISDVTMSHYQRLNIQQDADLGSIKSAYYSLSKIYHPDIADPDDTTAVEKFRLITESYNILSDPSLKSEYDRQFQVKPVTNYNSETFNQGERTTRDNNHACRVRDADMLFRSRQEAAMEREKRLNPKKFRAGSFSETKYDADYTTQDEIDRLKRRIDNLSASSPNSKDDFYRTHLFIAMQRRHAGLKDAQELNYQGGTSSDSGIVGPFLGLGIIAFAVFALFNVIVDYDIGAYLDSKLVFVQNQPDLKGSENEKAEDIR